VNELEDVPEMLYRYIRVDEPGPDPKSVRIRNGYLSTHDGWLNIEHDDGASWWAPGLWQSYIASNDDAFAGVEWSHS